MIFDKNTHSKEKFEIIEKSEKAAEDDKSRIDITLGDFPTDLKVFFADFIIQYPLRINSHIKFFKM